MDFISLANTMYVWLNVCLVWLSSVIVLLIHTCCISIYFYNVMQSVLHLILLFVLV